MNMPHISAREVEELQQSLIEALSAGGTDDPCDAVNILRLLLSEPTNIGERNGANGVESPTSGTQTPRWLSLFLFYCLSSCCFVVIGWCNSGRVRVRVTKKIVANG